jgi:hypothetical protein
MQAQNIEQIIVQELGRHRNAEEVTRMLCEQYGLDWKEAEQAVYHVAQQHRQVIVRRQSPFTMVLIIAGLLAGLGLVARLALAYFARGPMVFTSFSLLSSAGFGLMLIIGSLIGLVQMMHSLAE